MSAVSLFILCSSFFSIASAVTVSLYRDLPETHMNVVSFRFMIFTFYPLVIVKLAELSIAASRP